uniref:Uncharacterized protein n=1 Tax=Ananas comosus var. bracteatus TaxID=296719 RepID=A0A6V7QBK3_ANACO|nr:unnamed protein product [Ananas comosus var. bracteatus]
MKRVRWVAMESAPSSASFPGGEEARARFKHQSLLQDYVELLKETEAKRKQVLEKKQKKLKLLNEVKFLRRKFKSLTENPSQKTSYRLKKQLQKVPSSSRRAMQNATPTKERSSIDKEASMPSTFGVIDLNQVSLPNDEEMEEFAVKWEPVKFDSMKKDKMEGKALASDLNLPTFRDNGNGASRFGKRKITWHGQVALRV